MGRASPAQMTDRVPPMKNSGTAVFTRWYPTQLDSRKAPTAGCVRPPPFLLSGASPRDRNRLENSLSVPDDDFEVDRIARVVLRNGGDLFHDRRPDSVKSNFRDRLAGLSTGRNVIVKNLLHPIFIGRL